MTTVPCPMCENPIPSDHAAALYTPVKEKVEKLGGWQIFESDYAVGDFFTLDDGIVVLVHDAKPTYNSGDITPDGYGESPLSQGDTFATFVILNVAGSYFRKTGSGDSYGDVTWDGDFTIVKPKEITTLVFE